LADTWLNEYREEILELYRDNRLPQAKVIEILQKRHSITIPPTTLSRYLRTLPEARRPPAQGQPRVTPEEEAFLTQAKVFSWLRGAIEELSTNMGSLHGRMGELEDAAVQRHEAIKQLVGTPRRAERVPARVVPPQPLPAPRLMETLGKARFTPGPAVKAKVRRSFSRFLVVLLVWALWTVGMWYFYSPEIASFMLQHPSPLRQNSAPAPAKKPAEPKPRI